MKDLLERGLVFARDVRNIFKKADGERRNCPRCRGSGLLKQRRIWHWDSQSVGNDPCWFCEGVGVMPLFGLHGFMLGRATAAIETEKLREPVKPPVQIHLCLGKYPASKSRFSSYSPSQKVSSLLYKPSSVPVWVTDAIEELALQISEDSTVKGEEIGNVSMPGLLEGSKGLQRVASDSSLSPSSRSLASHGRPVQSSVKRLLPRGEDVLRLRNSAVLSGFDLKMQSTGGKQRDSPSGRYRIRMTSKANHTLNAPMVSSFRKRMFDRSRVSVPNQVYEMGPGLLSLASGAQLTPRMLTNNGIRRVKCVRRRRNHVREKMEKETIQNTWRLRRLLYTKPEQHTPSDPSDALQTFSGSWKDLSQKCLAELTASNHPSNKPRFSQLGPTAPYPSRVNQPFYGKLVGKLQLLPNVAT